MYIVGKSKLDDQGRVNISSFYRDKPEKVVIFIDVNMVMIEVIGADELIVSAVGKPSKLDEKGRVVLPDWIIDEIGEDAVLYLILDDDGRRYLSPKVGDKIL